MKSITIEFKRQSATEEELDNLIENIKKNFTVEDDSKDRYEVLRFVHIVGDDNRIEFGDGHICIQKVMKPHIWVSIYNHYIHAVEVAL